MKAESEFGSADAYNQRKAEWLEWVNFQLLKREAMELIEA